MFKMKRFMVVMVVYAGVVVQMHLFVPLSLGQEQSVLEGSGEEALSPQQEIKGSDRPALVTRPGHVTLDFKEADIKNVLRVLSYKSGINIVAGKDVTGTVTIRLTDVPWEKALDVVLRTYGFAYEKDENIIRVTTVENLEKEELVTEVFRLSYSRAEDTTDIVSDLLTERGRVRYDERMNVLIVTDVPTNTYKVEQVIKEIDARTPQILLDAKIIETTLNDTEKLGIDWTVNVTARGSQISSTFPFRNDLSDLVPSRFLPSGQTATETTTEVTQGGGSTQESTADFANANSFPFVQPENFSFGTLSFNQFKAVLEVLSSRSDTHIKANPHIVTLNNHPAEIVVGEILFIPNFERNGETGQFEITGYEERDLGLKLAVTPHVNDNGDIVLDLKPEVTALTGFQQFTPEVSAPLISTREATTQVMLRDAETIAIGGLVRENEVNTTKKIPILGDIPLLGYLFKSTGKTLSKTDLLFFVSVNILDENEASEMLMSSAN
jgi:type IV pilus assembly protein PilQ